MRFRPYCLVICLLLTATLAAWHSISSIASGPRRARFGDDLGKQTSRESRDTHKNQHGGDGEDETQESTLQFFQKKIYQKLMGPGYHHNSGREEDTTETDSKNTLVNGGRVKDIADASFKTSRGRNHAENNQADKWRRQHKSGNIIVQHGDKINVKEEEEEEEEETIPDFRASEINRRGGHLVVPADGTPKHDKWIVVTTIAPPTDDVIFLAGIPGWRVVVVGDTKTPAEWSHPNCIYLSVDEQLELGLTTPKHLPFKHYARKNVGYLYAIQHGADVIYETDDDNRPLDKLKSFELRPTTSGLLYSGNSTTFNPYRHFGQPTLWPRGFPLSQVGVETRDTYKVSNQWPTPTIQQGVVNGDPDMDAIFRLTRKLTLKPLTVTFDPAAPPVILPPGIFSPFNSQNTLFLKNALWALLIPTTTTFRMCDIWRGFWAQRLLWEIGGHLGFYPPNAYQQRNAHNYMADMEDEKEMYFDTDRLLAFLSKWICPENLSFFQCVYKLTFDMTQEGFWREGDVTITKHWLEDLVRVGYSEPKRLNYTWVRERIHDIIKNPMNKLSKQRIQNMKGLNSTVIEKTKALVTLQGTSVTFVPSDQISPQITPDKAHNVSQISRQADMISELCPGLPSIHLPTRPIRAPQTHPRNFNDILLIIVFNWPFYQNARISEIIYRPIFPNIIYCGENATEFSLATESFSDRQLSFVEAPRIQAGTFSAWCVVKAMQMNYHVKGYLVTGDDVLLNVWNFMKLDTTKAWFSETRYVFNVTHPSANHWQWWNTPIGSAAYTNAMKSLALLAKMDLDNTSPINEENVKPNINKNVNNVNNFVIHDNDDKIASDKTRKNTATNNNNHQLNNNMAVIKYLKQHSLTQRPSQFLGRLVANTGGPLMAVHAVSDTYYIPSRLKHDAIFYLSHFLAHNVFSELSVVTVLYGLEKAGNLESFHGTNLWMEERTNPWAKFNTQEFFLHPVKLSIPANLWPLCTAYLPLLLANSHGNPE